MIDLRGRRALITGSTQGVGREIALAIARAGGDVVLHGLELNEAAKATEAACREAGVEVLLRGGAVGALTTPEL